MALMYSFPQDEESEENTDSRASKEEASEEVEVVWQAPRNYMSCRE